MLPRVRKPIGVTGVSGSGKSSLVFDVFAAEGHRKYVESSSPKVHSIGKGLDRDVDFVEGLSPVLSIEQISAGSAGSRSTVANLQLKLLTMLVYFGLQLDSHSIHWTGWGKKRKP